MEKRFSTLIRWWFVPLLVTIIFTFASLYLLALQLWGIYYTVTVICVLLLLYQIALFVIALVMHKWWHSAGIFVSGILCAIMIFISLMVLTLIHAMDNIHGPNATELIDSLEVLPSDTLDILPYDSIQNTDSL